MALKYLVNLCDTTQHNIQLFIILEHIECLPPVISHSLEDLKVSLASLSSAKFWWRDSVIKLAKDYKKRERERKKKGFQLNTAIKLKTP